MPYSGAGVRQFGSSPQERDLEVDRGARDPHATFRRGPARRDADAGRMRGQAPDSPIKNAIFCGTNAKLYNYTPQQRSALGNDRFAQIRESYEKYGDDRSNLRYGYVAKPVA